MRAIFSLSRENEERQFSLDGDQLLRLVSAAMSVSRGEDHGGWAAVSVSHLSVPMIEGIIAGLADVSREKNPYDAGTEGDSWKAWYSGWRDASHYSL